LHTRSRFTIPVWRIPGGLSLALIALFTLLVACGDAEKPLIAVFTIDRTGVATSPAWADEVAVIAKAEVTKAIEAGATEADIISLGSGLGDTARAAKAKLNIDCPNKARCAEDREALAQKLAIAASQVASVPVEQNGTDIFAATRTALAICAGEPCRIIHITDGGDSRLLEAGSVEDLVKKYLSSFPDVRGQVVRINGIGADGSDPQFVDRVEAFWTELLAQAGAIDARVGRSL
jgi:hypothetical protein